MEHINQYGTYKPSARIELATSRLQDGCSTTKLKGLFYKKRPVSLCHFVVWNINLQKNKSI